MPDARDRLARGYHRPIPEFFMGVDEFRGDPRDAGCVITADKDNFFAGYERIFAS